MLKEASISSENVSLWSIQKQRIIEIQQTVLAHRLTAAESSTKHTKIVQDVMLLSEETLVESDLLLDPVKNTYFLTNATMLNAPRLAENIGLMRATGTAFLAAGSIDDEGRTKLAGMFSNVTLFFFDFMRNVEKATQSDLSMKAALESKRKLSTLSA